MEEKKHRRIGREKATVWKGGQWDEGGSLPAAVPETDSAINLMCDWVKPPT